MRHQVILGRPRHPSRFAPRRESANLGPADNVEVSPIIEEPDHVFAAEIAMREYNTGADSALRAMGAKWLLTCPRAGESVGFERRRPPVSEAASGWARSGIGSAERPLTTRR
jgi:hypothetical protein